MVNLENQAIMQNLNLLPDFEFTPFEAGLKETIEWFENNYDNIRK